MEIARERQMKVSLFERMNPARGSGSKKFRESHSHDAARNNGTEGGSETDAMG